LGVGMSVSSFDGAGGAAARQFPRGNGQLAGGEVNTAV
jgi:hypothetical protein